MYKLDSFFFFLFCGSLKIKFLIHIHRAYSQQEVSCNPNMRDKNALWNIEDNQYSKCKRTIGLSNLLVTRIYQWRSKCDVTMFIFCTSTERQFPSLRARIPRQIPRVPRRDAAGKFRSKGEGRRSVFAAMAMAYKLQGKLSVQSTTIICHCKIVHKSLRNFYLYRDNSSPEIIRGYTYLAILSFGGET